ncbi:SCP2 domain-containing protein [Cellvibrio sp.]|uniref:ubiquinone anaerobic biosynthesis accessory factor UbiT n=1 Tax=Cellvibrio sp. TaxID=1965322 RepID=UPI00396487DE
MSYLQSINHKVIAALGLKENGLNKTADFKDGAIDLKTGALAFALIKISRHTPKPILAAVLQMVLNHIFRQPLQAGDMNFLQNKAVNIVVKDMDLQFSVSLDEQQRKPKLCIGFDIRKVDLTFSSHSDYFLLMALNKIDPDTLFFQRKLSIKGDTDLGLYVKNLLASLDVTQHLPATICQWIERLATEIYNKKMASF